MNYKMVKEDVRINDKIAKNIINQLHPDMKIDLNKDFGEYKSESFYQFNVKDCNKNFCFYTKIFQYFDKKDFSNNKLFFISEERFTGALADRGSKGYMTEYDTIGEKNVKVQRYFLC